MTAEEQHKNRVEKLIRETVSEYHISDWRVDNLTRKLVDYLEAQTHSFTKELSQANEKIEELELLRNNQEATNFDKMSEVISQLQEENEKLNIHLSKIKAEHGDLKNAIRDKDPYKRTSKDIIDSRRRLTELVDQIEELTQQ